MDEEQLDLFADDAPPPLSGIDIALLVLYGAACLFTFVCLLVFPLNH